MKKLYTIILTIATLALFFTACTVEEKHKPGEPDVDGCYGVYFPAQTGSISLDPADPTVATINVARTNTTGAITVPYTVTGATDIVSAGEITFADGQSETTCDLSFASAEVGVSYVVNISITDPQYASKYNSQPIAFQYTIMRDKWNSLGMATFSDSFILEFTYEAELIQNDKNPKLFRLINPYRGVADEGNPVKHGPTAYVEFTLLSKGEVVEGVTISTADLVYFKSYYTGVYHNSYEKEIIAWYPGELLAKPTEGDYLYSKVLQYQENGLPAGVQLAPYYYMSGTGGWDKTQANDIVKIIFPGAVLTDYTLALEAGISDAEGKLPVDFTLGTDVEVVKYSVVEGALNAAQLEKHIGDIIDEVEPDVKSVTESSEVELVLPKTGVYTLVAVTFDAEGIDHESASVEFSYLAKGDEEPVVVNCGLIVTDKYAPKGFTSENSLEFYVFGKGVTGARIGLFKHLDVLTNAQKVIATLLKSKPISADDLAALNGDGLSDLYTKLSPGTGYDLLVWATNDYEETLIRANATTNGDPLPIYMSWSAADFQSSLAPEAAEGFYGEYNYYGVDIYGTLGVRENLGTVTIEESTRPKEGPDADGLYDEFITVKGVFADAAEKFGIVDSLTFDCYNGVIYSLLNDLPVTEGGYYPHVTIGATGSGNWGYDYDYLVVGGFVLDGHIAFVCNPSPSYASLGFNGLGLYFYEDAEHSAGAGWVAKIADLMFIDPDKDITAAPAMSASHPMNQIYNELYSNTNYVMTRDAKVRDAIDSAREYVTIQGVKANMDIVVDLPAVSFEATATPLVKKSFDKNAPIEVVK